MLAYILTFSRPVLAAAFAVVVAANGQAPLHAAGMAVLLVLSGLIECTDMLDGWAARRAGMASELGGLLDPLCDSLARLTVYFAAGLAGWVWLAVPLTMAGRDIIVAYVRVIVGSTGGKTSARLSGKLKAIVQGAGILAIVVLAGPWHEVAAVSLWRAAVSLAVLAVTLWSLVDYVRNGWPAIRQMARS